ncbi:hypothetical protein QTH87_25530 [Variovorax sp. J22P168]|uniref:hypothetical protein n=1 Tax=Variovorax jilinensis TaxID=3053513 RepID=UPI0025787D00|nr:hypothetical protein [Variovorax sp. J22P168]MDM0015826.1 hypothetical protein [Variovorax sp. J22P168]
MTEFEATIRESLLTTLSFLSSISQQREFASKVPYDSYAGEFAHWWFDTFYPDEPNASVMFDPRELLALRAFSEDFDRNITALSDEGLSIEELQATAEWKAIVESARTASQVLRLPAP